MNPFIALEKKFFQQTWGSDPETAPELVYHYTSASGLYGILESRRVWATDCRFLNDVSESQIGNNTALELLRARLANEKSDEKRSFYKALINSIGSDSFEPNFIFSMSERSDDLTQWRTYAHEGEGFTLGFDARAIQSASNRPESEFAFGQVSYNAHSLLSRITRSLDTFETTFVDLPEADRKADKVIKSAGVNFDGVVSAYSSSYKHSSFRSEREWRINSYVDTGDPDEEIRVRVCGQKLVPYVSLNIDDKDGNFPVRKIGIGPGFRDSSIQFSLEKLCRQFDIDAEIYSADTPFRRS